ncbi:hypothetical protein [Ferrimicrobium sp.]|uniref:hypothetical protein n=1 Tax=Ferrimicrobium sp. TaxID=2926050 RepID=UPI002629CBDE|nr:hypothetical protein [Ferrimicrobium sp.]
MNETIQVSMFGPALGLAPPWQVTSVDFAREVGMLQIGRDFPRGSRFACPIEGYCKSACLAHDTIEKSWRHQDFFECQVFLITWLRLPGLVPGAGSPFSCSAARHST